MQLWHLLMGKYQMLIRKSWELEAADLVYSEREYSLSFYKYFEFWGADEYNFYCLSLSNCW